MRGSRKERAADQDRRSRLKELRRAGARHLAALGLPEAADVAELCGHLGAARGRPIVLVPMQMPSTHPCGMWVAARDEDLIFYDANTTGAHQEHIIVHELGHIICCHRGAGGLDEAAARLLFPNLDPQLVRDMLLRAVGAHVEQEPGHGTAMQPVHGADLLLRFGTGRGCSELPARQLAHPDAQGAELAVAALGERGDHRGLLAVEAVGLPPRVLDGLPGEVDQQPVPGVHRGGVAWRDAVVGRVEAVDVGQQGHGVGVRRGRVPHVVAEEAALRQRVSGTVENRARGTVRSRQYSFAFRRPGNGVDHEGAVELVADLLELAQQRREQPGS